jgi:hypothetical protein
MSVQSLVANVEEVFPELPLPDMTLRRAQLADETLDRHRRRRGMGTSRCCGPGLRLMRHERIPSIERIGINKVVASGESHQIRPCTLLRNRRKSSTDASISALRMETLSTFTPRGKLREIA